MRFGTVGPSSWGDRPVYILGGGPSVKPYIERLKSLHEKGYVLSVNDGFNFCKPDVIFSIDSLWLENRKAQFPTMQAPVYMAMDPNFEIEDTPNLTVMVRKPRTKTVFLSKDSAVITNGLNSGFCALNFAYLKGAKEIFLLGFDFKGAPNESHFHQGYKWHTAGTTGRLYPIWASLFNDVAPQLRGEGVKVWNCSDNSLLTCFEYKSYNEVL